MQASIHGWVGEQSAQPEPAGRPSRRSVLLGGAAGIAAGIAAGVAAAIGIDRLGKSPAPGPGQLVVENGSWKPVKAVADLPEGTPVAFRSGAIEGFLIRRGQNVRGLSAVCTHRGCILNYSKFRDQFECPCHGATFKTNGQPTDQYDTPLPRLPSLEVRINNGQVEVFTV
jgi:cytochrome b6-f complex iron-sulfur subunit